MKKVLLLIFTTFLFFSSVNGQDFSNGTVYLKLTNAGSTLFGSPDHENLQITRISALVSGNKNEVFDYLNDADSTEEAASTLPSPRFGNYHVKSLFDNSYSFAPPAYKIELNAYGWLTGGFTISHYNVTNIDSFTYDSKFGFEVLPFIDNIYGGEKVEYYTEGDYVRIYKDSVSTFVGVKILSEPMTSLYVEDWVSGYNRADSSLYNKLFFESIIDTFTAADSGSVIFPSIASQTIAPGESYDVFIALAVGENFFQLDSNMTAAVAQYADISATSVNEEVIPKSITLEQNYPNPFNPSTNIKFTLPKKEFVEVSIYNSIGQLVETLVKKELFAGVHELKFNAGGIASGVYFYRLKTENFVSTKKMLLIK